MSDSIPQTTDAAPVLNAETRASMFIDWCALQGFGREGWPPGAYAQLVAHLKEAEDQAYDRGHEAGTYAGMGENG
jgi:hypothetical protein